MIRNLKSVTSHDLDSPVTNCHTFLDPSLRLGRDVLYGRPLAISLSLRYRISLPAQVLYVTAWIVILK